MNNSRKRSDIAILIESLGYPYAYFQFTEDTAQAPPFICFFYSTDDSVHADDTNYAKIEQLNIEFYSAIKDFEAETAIEDALIANGFSYYKEQTYIETEKLYMTSYEMEVLINGEQ